MFRVRGSLEGPEMDETAAAVRMKRGTECA
jgi:hypothetical protein